MDQFLNCCYASDSCLLCLQIWWHTTSCVSLQIVTTETALYDQAFLRDAGILSGCTWLRWILQDHCNSTAWCKVKDKNSEFWEDRISVQKGCYEFPTLGGMRNCLMTRTLCHLHGHSLVLKCMSLWVCPKPIFHINAFSWAFWKSSGSYSRSIQVLFFELVLDSISRAVSFVFLY